MNNKPIGPSGLTRLLVTRLISNQFSLNPKVLGSSREKMRARIFAKRLKRAGNGKIPHPIFSNRLADFGHFVQIWNARVIIARLPEINCVEKIPISPSEIRFLRNKFEKLIAGKFVFALQFYSKHCNILIKFTPLNDGQMKLTLVRFDLKLHVISSIDFLKMDTVSISNSSGVELKTNCLDQAIKFFYTTGLTIPFGLWNYHKFVGESVTFYTITSKRKRIEPLCESMKKLAIAPHA